MQGWPWPSKFQPLGGVAVIARNTGAAIKGRDALKIVWDDGPNADLRLRKPIAAELEEAARKPGKVVRNDGDVEAALKSADKVAGRRILPAASGACQHGAAGGDRQRRRRQGRGLGAACKARAAPARTWRRRSVFSVDNVTVNVTLLGGGFGRKSKCDFVLEAALLSRAVGAPVKVTWTREDDIRHDFLHTVSAERIEAGLDENGKVIAWRHRSAAPTILSTFVAGAKNEAPFELGMGLVDLPFADPQHPLRESGSRGPHPDRLVPLGLQHPARLRDPVDGRRDSRTRPGAIRRTCCSS